MLTLPQVGKYNQALIASKLLSPDGPFSLLDVHRLTKGMLHHMVVGHCAAANMNSDMIAAIKQQAWAVFQYRGSRYDMIVYTLIFAYLCDMHFAT